MQKIETPNQSFCEKCKKPVRNRTKCISCTLALKTNSQKNNVKQTINSSELEYLKVLMAIRQVSMYKSFNMGKKLLTDFLRGDNSNKSIQRNRLYQMKYFGSLRCKEEKIREIIERLILNGLIIQRPFERNSFSKILELTGRGQREINNPTLYKKKLAFSFKETEAQITSEDEAEFEKFDLFLKKFNPEQKKAIISGNKHILCIAGAGSGKTTVLTKRIEFLVNKKGVKPEKILAITFTKKAKGEMKNRLFGKEDLKQVSIETFNSFSEKILRKHNDVFYGKKMRVITFGERIALVSRILGDLAKTSEDAIEIYFSPAQRRGKSPEQLYYTFINDCFFIRDHFKTTGKELNRSSFFSANVINSESTQLVFNVCKSIEEYMQENGLRDFTDQNVDVVALFNKYSHLIPEYEHILVDEYQDVNSIQIKLLNQLNPQNLFCVGDPRQSIFGWRGSELGHILDFESRYPDCEIVTLTKNYRSTRPIVDLMNSSIENMGIKGIESQIKGKNSLYIKELGNEKKEFEFVIEKIRKMYFGKSVFVLARTNKQLTELSLEMEEQGVPHSIRSEENKFQKNKNKKGITSASRITLATIHAIKGMEAEVVFILGCSGQNFPNKTSEHPIIDMIKSSDYDKEEEERRLFYVALSRAKTKLYLTYSSQKPTHFITEEMLAIIEYDSQKEKEEEDKKQVGSVSKINGRNKKIIEKGDNLLSVLKQWRFSTCKKHSVPAYRICTNRTLEELIKKRPVSINELRNVYGLGPAKISEYGEELIEMIRSSVKEGDSISPNINKNEIVEPSKLGNRMYVIEKHAEPILSTISEHIQRE